jgi:hypothetical protein
MNDPDNFLSRWSRRKREAGESKEEKEETTSAARAGSTPENEPDGGASAPAPSPEFDTASLPPIESISTGTDITAFMRAGVPETLKHAALRRAWSSDPGVRDFVGLNENFWDAPGPDGIPGFGDIDPNLDVRRMVSDLFGETPRQNTAPEPEADRVADSSALPIQNKPEEASPPGAISPPAEPVPQRKENAAVQTEPPASAPEKKFARRHGGAMPQ